MDIYAFNTKTEQKDCFWRLVGNLFLTVFIVLIFFFQFIYYIILKLHQQNRFTPCLT